MKLLTILLLVAGVFAAACDPEIDNCETCDTAGTTCTACVADYVLTAISGTPECVECEEACGEGASCDGSSTCVPSAEVGCPTEGFYVESDDDGTEEPCDPETETCTPEEPCDPETDTCPPEEPCDPETDTCPPEETCDPETDTCPPEETCDPETDTCPPEEPVVGGRRLLTITGCTACTLPGCKTCSAAANICTQCDTGFTPTGTNPVTACTKNSNSGDTDPEIDFSGYLFSGVAIFLAALSLI